MYLPTSILGKLNFLSKDIKIYVLGAITYGDSLGDSIINSLQTRWIQSAVNIFITLHIIFTLIIMFNPLNQDIEEALKVPHGKDAWKPYVTIEYNNGKG